MTKNEEYLKLLKFIYKPEFKTLPQEEQDEWNEKFNKSFSEKIEEDDRLRHEATLQARRDAVGKSFELKLNVPSGKIVFANDLRSLFPELDKDQDYSIRDETKSMLYTSNYYAPHGLIQVFISNTSPRINQNGNTFIINPFAEWDEETDERISPEGFTKIGYICTDLWWWSAMDYDHYVALSESLDEEQKEFLNKWIVVANVDPGVYTINSTMSTDGGENWPQYGFKSVITKE